MIESESSDQGMGNTKIKCIFHMFILCSYYFMIHLLYHMNTYTLHVDGHSMGVFWQTSHLRIPMVLCLALRSATFRLKALSELKSSLMVGNRSDGSIRWDLAYVNKDTCRIFPKESGPKRIIGNTSSYMQFIIISVMTVWPYCDSHLGVPTILDAMLKSGAFLPGTQSMCVMRMSQS